MARSQGRSRLKSTGGLYRYLRGKRKSELAGLPANSKLEAKTVKKPHRTLGGHYKQKILSTNVINVSSGEKTTKTEILNVVQNPANPNLVRRNIFNKGAVVETALGKVRITSRPGQDGTVQGILIGKA